MSLAESRKEVYLEEKVNRELGNLNGIPLYHTFPKLGGIIKSIPKGYPILLTANSGIGKTQTWIGIFVYNIYNLKKNHPELNLNVKLVIALLEDTKEMFIDRLYSMMFYNLYGIIVDADVLHSRGEKPLPQHIVDKFPAVQIEIDIILNDCEIIDSIYNPTGLYKWARTITQKLGTHHNKIATFTDEKGIATNHEVYSHYEPFDKNQQVLMVVDNLNNLSSERNGDRMMDERETINMWSRNYCRLQITKHWKWSVINIIQQSAGSEAPSFDYKGNLNVEKCKPTLSDLGNSKECQRDHFIVLGIFSPNRYGISTYAGFNINRLGDNFRTLIILKSNLSATNIEIPYQFQGACSLLRELPTGMEIHEDDYIRIDKLNKQVI